MRSAFVALTLTLAMTGPSGRAVAQARIDRVAWMAGCWRLTTEGRTVDEQWTSPGGGAMLGISRTVKGDRLLEYEFVVLREQGDGLVYVAQPSGQPGGEFPSKSVDGESVVFENPQHDFPQRIGYRRRGERLEAWIEGVRGGATRRIEFPYTRVSCPAG